MPNNTAMTIRVRPGQASTATPASSVMIPNAMIHTQLLPTRARMSAGSGRGASVICVSPCQGGLRRPRPFEGKPDRYRPLADGRGDPLGGATADIAHRKDARLARLQ